MKRLSLLLDEIAQIRTATDNNSFDPVYTGIIAETAGVQGLVCTYSGNKKGISERDVRVLKELCKTTFNLRIPLDRNSLHLALSVAPDMVTFIDIPPGQAGKVGPVNPSLHMEDIERMVADLEANNISTALLVEPEINILRSISRVNIDYVELSAHYYSHAPDTNDELIALDKIRSAAVAAAKLGIGVNCSGGLTTECLYDLAQIPNLEDLIIGSDILSSAMNIGIEKSVKNAIEIIRSKEIN